MTPQELANKRYELSVEYARLSELLEEVLMKKADAWSIIRDGHKSDTAAERAWLQMPVGKEETSLRMQIKRNEKQSSALSSLLKVKENEARGIW